MSIYASEKICSKCGSDKRYALDNRCVECKRVYNAKWNKDNIQHRKRGNKKRWQENKKTETERTRRWRKNNAEYDSTYRREHKARINAHTSNRRACKLQRTPSWLTEEHLLWISWYYKQSSLLTSSTGINHVVDHIYPLLPKDGSGGLHVPWNLQVITEKENRDKSNKVVDNMN